MKHTNGNTRTALKLRLNKLDCGTSLFQRGGDTKHPDESPISYTGGDLK